MTANVIAKESSTVESQTDHAWLERSLQRLEQNPVFCRIVDELTNPVDYIGRKASTRGYPRYAFAA